MSELYTWTYDTAGNRAAAERAARLRSLEYNWDSGSLVMVREWPQMDARAADDFANSASTGLRQATAQIIGDASPVDDVAATYPMADGQSYSGAWNVSKIDIEGQQDRSATVVQTLVQPKTSGSKGESYSTVYVPDHARKLTRYFYIDNTLAQYTTAHQLWDDVSKADIPSQSVEISGATPNRRGTLDFIVTVTLYNNQDVSSYTSYKGRNQTRTRTEYVNSSTEPALTGDYGSAYKKYDPQSGLWNGNVEDTTYLLDGDGILRAGFSNSYDRIEYEWQTRTGAAGTSQSRKIKWLKDITHHNTAGAAAEAMNESEKPGHPTKVDTAIWRAIKYHDRSIAITWTPDP